MNNFKIFKKLNYNEESKEKKAQIDSLSDKIIKEMTNLGYRQVIDHDKDKDISYVFSIGGDGTMLHAMQRHVDNNSIVIGINAGNLGFLTPFNVEDVFKGDIFSMLNTNRYKIEKRSILKSYIDDKNESTIAVNEFAFYGSEVNSLFNFSLEIDYNGQSSKAGTYKANTLIVSGPCGSTAYSMNAGGCIVDPTVRCMQIVMIAPSTIVRPLIIGKNSKIKVIFKNKSKIFVDGTFYKDSNIGETMLISLVQEEVKVLLPLDWNFYGVLSKKLHWNNGKEV